MLRGVASWCSFVAAAAGAAFSAMEPKGNGIAHVVCAKLAFHHLNKYNHVERNRSSRVVHVVGSMAAERGVTRSMNMRSVAQERMGRGVSPWLGEVRMHSMRGRGREGASGAPK
jgi:hypothetical protein